MNLIIGLLTIIIVLDCLFLILLVLVQLPKKEAGLGQAFGGGTTDALFGAGAGNVLTKLTTWCGAIFLVLALTLSLLHKYQADSNRIGGGGVADSTQPGENPPANPQQPGTGSANPGVPPVNPGGNGKTPATGNASTASNGNGSAQQKSNATKPSTSNNTQQPADNATPPPAGNASKKN